MNNCEKCEFELCDRFKKLLHYDITIFIYLIILIKKKYININTNIEITVIM